MDEISDWYSIFHVFLLIVILFILISKVHDFKKLEQKIKNKIKKLIHIELIAIFDEVVGHDPLVNVDEDEVIRDDPVVNVDEDEVIRDDPVVNVDEDQVIRDDPVVNVDEDEVVGDDHVVNVDEDEVIRDDHVVNVDEDEVEEEIEVEDEVKEEGINNELSNRYSDMEFSPQLCEAINNGVIEVKRGFYIMLIAQMQSGKTDCFMGIGVYLFLLGLIDSIIIFSGNTEIAMREQHNNINEKEKFYNKFEVFVRNLPHDELSCIIQEKICQLKQFIMNKIIVIWGCDLDKYNYGVIKKTLFIWDESHYAQDINNRPAKFLQKINVSVNGDTITLEENNNFFISVSATPMSEYSGNKIYEQNKPIIYLKPGDNYKGVKKLMDNGLIIHYNNLNVCIKNVISECPNNKYLIIRTSSKTNKEYIKKICQENGVIYKEYDQTTINRTNINDDILKNIPNIKTVILINKLLTMGQRIVKNNIYACIETTIKIKTDTLLQGLIGRCCGYYNNEIKVYININNDFSELLRFLKMHAEGIIGCPNKAKNLKPIKNDERINIIPMTLDKFSCEGGRPTISCCTADLLASLNDNTICNNNNLQITNKIINLLETGCKIKLCDGDVSTYMHEYCNIKNWVESYPTSSYKSPKGGCGFDATDGKQINIWFKRGVNNKIFVVSAVIIPEKDCDADTLQLIQLQKLPKTTKKEVFAHKTEESNINVITNCIFARNLLPELLPETSTNVNIMFESLSECIMLSILNQQENTYLSPSPRRITSNRTISGWTGIFVTIEILNELKKKGGIYMNIFRKFNGIKITFKKVPGRRSSKYAEFERLSEISW